MMTLCSDTRGEPSSRIISRLSTRGRSAGGISNIATKSPPASLLARWISSPSRRRRNCAFAADWPAISAPPPRRCARGRNWARPARAALPPGGASSARFRQRSGPASSPGVRAGGASCCAVGAGGGGRVFGDRAQRQPGRPRRPQPRPPQPPRPWRGCRTPDRFPNLLPSFPFPLRIRRVRKAPLPLCERINTSITGQNSIK